MNQNEPLKEVASVSDVARMLGLSRSRFYQLMSEGVFPPPSRNEETGRPFYNREQQETCVRVRSTNCGLNGRPILFYARRLDGRPDNVPKGKDRRGHPPRESPQDAFLDDLRDGLSRLGIVPGCDTTIRTAVRDCFPDGYAGIEMATILATVFRHLSRQDAQDNVSG